MKRALLATLVLCAGCATLAPQKEASVPEARPSDICEYIGNRVYNPRLGYTDPLEAEGPTRIIWMRQPPRLMSDAHGGLYECHTAT